MYTKLAETHLAVLVESNLNNTTIGQIDRRDASSTVKLNGLRFIYIDR